MYGFPPGTGAGQTIALVQLGGGFTASDLRQYFGALGLPVPRVRTLFLGRATNNPKDQASSMEVALDMQVAGAIAPDATLLVVFAPNSFTGFCDAVQAACANATIVSISWGAPERYWPSTALHRMNSILQSAVSRNVNVFAASGDHGSGNSVGPSAPGRPAFADFPASSPNVIACGGTTLVSTDAGASIASEKVWHDALGNGSGGAFSATFPAPPCQRPALPSGPPLSSSSRVPSRGVPDVCGCADPSTGYRIVLNGSMCVVGGTSAVAPLYAGLAARLAPAPSSAPSSASAPASAPASASGPGKRLLKPGGLSLRLTRRNGSGSAVAAAAAAASLPWLLPVLYTHATRAVVDITVGNNGAFRAAVGWDAASGLGRIHGPGMAAAVGVTMSNRRGTVPAPAVGVGVGVGFAPVHAWSARRLQYARRYPRRLQYPLRYPRQHPRRPSKS